MSNTGTISLDKIKELYTTFSKLFEEHVLNRNLIPIFDRVWIALHCLDMCVYKQFVNYFALGLKEYRDMWNKIALELLNKLGVKPDEKEPLRTVLKIGDREVRMNQLINMLLLMYFSEHEELCRQHVEQVRIRLRALSDYAKRLLRVIASDQEAMIYSFFRFDEKWLGEHYKERMEQIYGPDIDMKQLEIAVVELNKAGLIMYCNIVIRDFQKLDVKVINEYYLAPHLAPIWRNPDQYL